MKLDWFERHTWLTIIMIPLLFCLVASFNEIEAAYEKIKLQQVKIDELEKEVYRMQPVKRIMQRYGCNNVRILRAIRKQKSVPPEVAAILISIESEFNPNAVSSCGARGLMQIHPCHGKYSTFDIEKNVEYGCRYFKEQLDKYGSIERAIWAYNAGPGMVGIYMPEETRCYIARFNRMMVMYGC